MALSSSCHYCFVGVWAHRLPLLPFGAALNISEHSSRGIRHLLETDLRINSGSFKSRTWWNISCGFCRRVAGSIVACCKKPVSIISAIPAACALILSSLYSLYAYRVRTITRGQSLKVALVQASIPIGFMNLPQKTLSFHRC